MLSSLGTLCLLGMVWSGTLWSSNEVLGACRTVAGLVLVLFWPGALLAASRLRRENLPFQSVLHFVTAAAALSLCVQSTVLVGVTAAVRALAGEFAGYWDEPWFVVAQSAIACSCLGISVLFPRPVRIALPSRLEAGATVAGAVAIGAFVLLTFRPSRFDETRYWPLEAEMALDKAEVSDGIATTYGPAWTPVDERTYSITTERAAATIANTSSQPVNVRIMLLVEAHTVGEIRVILDGKQIVDGYAHERFVWHQHPRNYPPPNLVLAARASLSSGSHELVVDFGHRGRRMVTDLTGVGPQTARRIFGRRYLIANIGDTQENVQLARSLFGHPFPRETSYAGEIFDGGGYAISNLPFPYYPYALALLTCGDKVMSLGWLHIAMLVGIWAALRKLAFGSGAEQPGRVSWPLEGLCLLSVLGFAALMRFMVESLYVHTTLTLVFVVAMYHWLRGNRRTFLAYSAFCVLTKGGLVLMALLLGIGFILGVCKRREVVRSAGMVASLAIVLGAAILIFGWATDSLAAWQEDLFGDDYVDRFGLIEKALLGDWGSGSVVGRAGWELTKHVLAAGGLVAVACLLGGDRVSVLLIAVGAVFHALICVSDPAFDSWGHRVHPLNYFTPAAPLLAVAGLRSLCQARGKKWPKWVAVGLLPLMVTGVIWCQSRSRTYRLSPRMADAWRVMHVACVNDSLLRRAESVLKGGDHLSPEADAARVLWLCGRHELDHRLTYQKGKAHYLLARCALREGDKAGATAQLRAMLDTSPRFAEVYRRCVQQLGD